MGQQATCADGSDSHSGTLDQERTTVRHAPGRFNVFHDLLLTEIVASNELRARSYDGPQRCGRCEPTSTTPSDCRIGRADQTSPEFQACPPPTWLRDGAASPSMARGRRRPRQAVAVLRQRAVAEP